MNKEKRVRLKESKNMLNKALSIVDSVKDEEENALNNFPENLQNSERYTAIEDAVDCLEDIMCDLEHAIDRIDEIC